MDLVEKMHHSWELIFQEFVEEHPDKANGVIDWYPCGQMKILLRYDNGDKKIYDYLDQKLSDVCAPIFEYDDSEEEWKRRFGLRLRRKLSIAGVTQWQLAEKTGISEVTISKYLNGRATPSAYNVDRIAWVLNCDASDLMRDI